MTRACRTVRAHGSARGRSVSSTTSPRVRRRGLTCCSGSIRSPSFESSTTATPNACRPVWSRAMPPSSGRARHPRRPARSPIVLGGDHSVAYPNLVAMAKHHGTRRRRRHPVRHPRGHGRHRLGRSPIATARQCGWPWTRLDPRRPLHPGGPSGLLAARGRVRLDALGRDALAHDVRGRGAGYRRRDRHGDRRGLRAPARDRVT